jgi:hypothetical protein
VGRPGTAGRDLVDLAANMPSDSQSADLHVLHRGKDLVAVARRKRGTRQEVANQRAMETPPPARRLRTRPQRLTGESRHPAP